MNCPSVTVLLPVYNAAAYVEEAVRSILQQTFTDFELLILDDGSTDSSGQLLEGLAFQDRRIRLVRRENRGLIATLNEGLALARGEFIARMDADDRSMPERLALQYARMQNDADLLALGSGIRYLDAAGSLGRRVIYPSSYELREALLWGAPLAHPAVMLRTEAVRYVGGYSPLFPYAEDYALWLRLNQIGKLDNLQDILVLYRVHEASVSHQHALQQRTSSLRAQAFWLLDMPPDLSLLAIEDNFEFLAHCP